jgi:hypothetical protein
MGNQCPKLTRQTFIYQSKIDGKRYRFMGQIKASMMGQNLMPIDSVLPTAED